MSKLIERLASASKIKESAILSESIYTTSQSKPIPTPVPMVNVALSGSINGGITGGITTLAGPSKHFKTNFSLLAVASYLADDPEAVCLFYDSEFGSPPDYFKSFGIDIDRVMHIPVKDAEEFQFDIIAQLQEIKRKDKVIIVLDSLGNLASKKELEDAKNEKSVQDMSRAKKFKGLFRMVTPYLKMNDIPMFVINHTYKTQEMFAKDVVSGGTGITYSSDSVWIIGRRQDKVGQDIKGYHFVIKIEKSRFVKEGSKIPISVSFDGGIMKYSGLLDVALEGKYVVKPKNGWYRYGHDEDAGNVREKETYNKSFWDPIFASTDFEKYVTDRFTLAHTKMIEDEDNGDSQNTENGV